ncbi:hypothetical protein DVV81_04710 [Clostridium botulinum]|uniref:hypothetical protein n=1 Tax=Clostridium botulinum TaxID=1491 RepID=UPI0019679E97|nr:hypothetical protein [Clostridium botulinum]MBN1070474.1 hypothetical protein [Clostridium botulinum]
MNDIDDFLGLDEEPTGIPLNDRYRIESLDELNVVVKEKYIPKPTEENPSPEEKWRTISYHPNLELAFKSIVDKEINITASLGLGEVVKKINELKTFKEMIQ